ncbi:hypothetical protein [Paraburkholderia terrae]|uniref:hypothetical protein n=1 Tax=Paraburkholderia terrae TaxID=311230 RepID=UPI001EE2AE23|nr:hypothetical protein [Paraburkholderia terrae]GJH02277.1 hypothetical protein CBA19C8_16990 [Paraburkholderia terrae]
MNAERLKQLHELANETADQLANVDQWLDDVVTLNDVCKWSAFLHYVGLHLNAFSEQFPNFAPFWGLCAEVDRLQIRTLEMASKMHDYGDDTTANGDTIH